MLSPPVHPAGFIEPCLPTPSRTLPSGPRWAFEIKHDGFRFLARRDNERVRVFGPHGRDRTDRVPLIVEVPHALPVTSVTLNGEGVVVDDRDVMDFERLRSALAGRGGSPAVFSTALTCSTSTAKTCAGTPGKSAARRSPASCARRAPGIRLSEHLDSDGETIFRHACRLGAEGIVAKRRDRPYRSGRSADWVKVRNPDAPAASRIMEW